MGTAMELADYVRPMFKTLIPMVIEGGAKIN
jgi:hypothetical protein